MFGSGRCDDIRDLTLVCTRLESDRRYPAIAGERKLVNSFFDFSPRRVARRQFVAKGTAALAGGLVVSPSLVFGDPETTENVQVETTYGRIRGLKTDGLSTFKGILYGGSVSGANRFKALCGST
jgi:hypothetical protein